MTTYTRLSDGTIGVKGTGIRGGMIATIKRDDGGTESICIARILETLDDGTQIATLADVPRTDYRSGYSDDNFAMYDATDNDA